ncbi:hypothetical protein [Delftia sp. HK171]|uniref:hypothetical protein n=1 Tax=Delftia sp. HK171 TaxID=1920191 RepID=UPI00115311E4|nr:hypothetical protein [Delftia sp. HK171]TQL81039.1 hypothetical protein FB549_2588 [Delftia sp. HK171]
MEKMILVIDESGAKGYAKTEEKYFGEIGVMAGFLYTEQEMLEIEGCLDIFLNPYKNDTNGKFHITDLASDAQMKLRDDIFHFIRKSKLQWFYHALYSQGFHQSEFGKNRGGENNSQASLHATLFKAMFCISAMMSELIGIKKLNLLVKTDNIDSGVIKKFHKSAEEIIDLLMRKERNIFRHVRGEDGKYEKKFSRVTTKTDAIPTFEEISLDIVCENSNLTILADILANSVYHHLDKAQKETPNIYLNNKETLKNHPVIDLAFIPKSIDHVVPITDIIYRRQ